MAVVVVKCAHAISEPVHPTSGSGQFATGSHDTDNANLDVSCGESGKISGTTRGDKQLPALSG